MRTEKNPELSEVYRSLCIEGKRQAMMALLSSFGEMAGWDFGLFCASWLLWAIAAGAATRSYQV